MGAQLSHEKDGGDSDEIRLLSTGAGPESKRKASKDGLPSSASRLTSRPNRRRRHFRFLDRSLRWRMSLKFCGDLVSTSSRSRSRLLPGGGGLFQCRNLSSQERLHPRLWFIDSCLQPCGTFYSPGLRASWRLPLGWRQPA